MKKLIIFLLAALFLSACSPYALPPGPDACSLGWEECNRLATQQVCEELGGSSQDCFAQSMTSSSAELGGPPDQEEEPLVVIEQPEETSESANSSNFAREIIEAIEKMDESLIMLFYNPVYHQSCTSPDCFHKEIDALDGFTIINSIFYGPGSPQPTVLDFEVLQNDTSCFLDKPTMADHCITVSQEDNGGKILVGFTDIGGEYYITDLATIFP